MKVWKYRLVKIGDNVIEIPRFGSIIAGKSQSWESFSIWVIVTQTEMLEKRHLFLAYTGMDVPDGAMYICSDVSGELVYHLFEIEEP